MRTVERVVAAPEGLGSGLVQVPEGTELRLDLRLESVSEGVLVSGTVRGTAVGECGRCLRPIELELDVPVQELYAYPDSTTEATTDEDEISRVQDDRIDLEPLVRDAVVPALATTPLGRPGCPGLWPGCGAHWDGLAADHRQGEEVGPRWAALRKLL